PSTRCFRSIPREAAARPSSKTMRVDGQERPGATIHGTGEPRAQERGVTYLALMLVVVLMGISFTALAREWKVLVKRDREAELLFRGNRIKTALEQFGANYEVM